MRIPSQWIYYILYTQIRIMSTNYNELIFKRNSNNKREKFLLWFSIAKYDFFSYPASFFSH